MRAGSAGGLPNAAAPVEMCLLVQIQELLCDLLLGQLSEGGYALSLAEHEPAVAGDALSGPVVIGLVVGVDALDAQGSGSRVDSAAEALSADGEGFIHGGVLSGL